MGLEKENVYIYNGILTIKRKEIFIYARKWTEIKNIIFDDRKETQTTPASTIYLWFSASET